MPVYRHTVGLGVVRRVTSIAGLLDLGHGRRNGSGNTLETHETPHEPGPEDLRPLSCRTIDQDVYAAARGLDAAHSVALPRQPV